MLDRIEKIQWVASGLAVAAVAGLFFYPGLSTPVSDIAPPAIEIDTQKFAQGMSAAAAEKHDKESHLADTSRKAATGAMTPAQKKYFVVPQPTIARLSDTRHVITELDTAQSELDAKKRELTLKGIKDESLLKTFGFQPGDVIKGLNGKPIPFDDENALWGLYNEQRRRFAAGEPIIVAFERDGKPVQFHFTSDKLGKLLR
ncbi:MAG TPA: hypothetical protein DCM87_01845 [Planctomycetes bacterium]|nr:hypothetical protein [Planctomycetota bacterium]